MSTQTLDVPLYLVCLLRLWDFGCISVLSVSTQTLDIKYENSICQTETGYTNTCSMLETMQHDPSMLNKSFILAFQMGVFSNPCSIWPRLTSVSALSFLSLNVIFYENLPEFV